jgi:hypothetical protein
MTQFIQHHPVFAERFPYNIQDFLDQITLVVTVINKKSSNKPDRDFGWISFGRNFILLFISPIYFHILGRNASGSAQIAHWDSMLNANGETITRWHALLDK